MSFTAIADKRNDGGLLTAVAVVVTDETGTYGQVWATDISDKSALGCKRAGGSATLTDCWPAIHQLTYGATVVGHGTHTILDRLDRDRCFETDHRLEPRAVHDTRHMFGWVYPLTHLSELDDCTKYAGIESVRELVDHYPCSTDGVAIERSTAAYDAATDAMQIVRLYFHLRHQSQLVGLEADGSPCAWLRWEQASLLIPNKMKEVA